MSTPLARARALKTAEEKLANAVSVEALKRMELDELIAYALGGKAKYEEAIRRVKRYYAVYQAESTHHASHMDADGDGVLDEHSWDDIRTAGRSEPSLQELIWEMDEAKLELDTFKEVLKQTQLEKDEAEEARAKFAAEYNAATNAIEKSGSAEAVAAAQMGIAQQEAAEKKAEYDAGAFDRLIKHKDRYGYAPPSGGLDTAAAFFGNDGIFPTKVPLEMHDMRMHLPLGYRYHVRSQVEAPPEIQSDCKSLFVHPSVMPQTHACALGHRGAARPGYPYLRSYEWPAE
jgi:hypothetical protein